MNKKILLTLNFTLVLFVTVLRAQYLPNNWQKSGPWAGDYAMQVSETEGINLSKCLHIKSKSNYTDAFVFIEQSFKAKTYIGKTIKLKGFIKPAQVKNLATLFISTNYSHYKWNTKNIKSKITNNPIVKETNNYTSIEIEMLIEKGTQTITIGALLMDNGAIWLDDFSLEIAGETKSDIQSTTYNPKNLQFEEKLSYKPEDVLGYEIKDSMVIFTFNSLSFLSTTDGMTGMYEKVKDDKISTVYIAGDFNNWDSKDNNFKMNKVNSVYQLSKKISDLGNKNTYEFKFVINGRKWVELPSEVLNKSQASNWVNTYNLVLVIP